MDKPQYKRPGISSVESLAKMLDVYPDLLRDIANKVDSSYTSFQIPKKSSELFRTVCEPKHELKKLQKKINSRIFELVEFPFYLQGGIKDAIETRDYVKNSSIHVKPSILINVDIKNFYPNIHRNYVSNVFQYFFGFHPDVAELLTKLTTLNDRVPQGGCCSSYLANLIFYAEEFKLVVKLRKKGWRYSRLLDDITLSSVAEIKDHISPIKEIAMLCKRYGLKLNNSKTNVSHRKNGIANLCVTGVWIGQGSPKLKKEERRHIRNLIYVCEEKSKISRNDENYHQFWNMVSGKVAKLKRMDHVEAEHCRARLQKIMPTYDVHERNSIYKEVKTLCSKQRNQKIRIGVIDRINKAHYKLGILSRTEPNIAKTLRAELNEKHQHIPTLKQFWS